jgi:hypothetical protein
MENEQPREGVESVQRDRKERGEVRDAHLDAAREHAQRANARARERNQTDDDRAEANDQAQRNARRGTDEASLKAQARVGYEGTDEDFEREWPAIRERLASEEMQKGVERIRRRL